MSGPVHEDGPALRIGVGPTSRWAFCPSVARARPRGFVLLPIALLLAMVAVLVYALNRQSSLALNLTAQGADGARARYLAEAGMQHALWLAQERACAGDRTLPSASLGTGSYAATVTTGGATTAYRLRVDRDAWIKSDSPDNNYGDGNTQHIRYEVGKIEHGLYRFDLSSLPAGAQINAASAWFHVKSGKEHPEGPLSIHRITADWNETEVTWDTFGGSFDAQLLATVPAQAEEDVWVRVNLTHQVQAWVNGEPNYGILLASTAEGVDTEYASRESAKPPRLEVVVGRGDASPATVESTGVDKGGVKRNLRRTEVALHQPPSNVVLQPGVDLNDAYMRGGAGSGTNYGMAPIVSVSNLAQSRSALLRFALSAVPRPARVLSATLGLYLEGGEEAKNGVLHLHRVRRAWVEGEQDGAAPGAEGGVTHNDYDGTNPWTTPGGDYDPTPIDTVAISSVASGWYVWDVSAPVQDWLAGAGPNHGFLLRAEGEKVRNLRFTSGDSPAMMQWPRLSVTLACECGVACMAPQGSGNVLLVVRDADNPGPQDVGKRDLFASWGYTVEVVDDDASAAAFDDAIADNDVAYVSESSEEASVNTKLTDTEIGVVSEDGALNDELGIASDYANPVHGDAIDIADNRHYITTPFGRGRLRIYAAPMEGLVAAAPVAGGLQTLGTWGSDPALAAVEVGGSLVGGAGPAAGRRVLLPLGRRVEANFDWDHLNNNGLLIVQRAIQWGVGSADAAASGRTLWMSTRDDVTSSGSPGLDAWTDGEALRFADPNLALEPGSTNGTFSSMFNLDDFAADGNADIDAIHYVGREVTVGNDKSVDLLIGDVLLSTTAPELLISANIILVTPPDVFVFRPDTPGDYSSGSFIHLLDGPLIHGALNTVGISLVEKDTAVGDAVLSEGSFLMALAGRSDVMEFIADDVGVGTTNGTLSAFIVGAALGFGSDISGLDLVEEPMTIGGHALPTGSIVVTLDADDPGGVADNGIPVDGADIFYLTVTKTGSSPVADATLLFEGLDVYLDTSAEHLQAITLTNAPLAGGGP